MKKTILITGSSGMLAKHFYKKYSSDYSIRFLTRKATKNNDFLWNIEQQYIDPKALEGVDVIIHLAGASITGKRWSEKRKKLLLSSRVDSTNLLFSEVKKQNITLDAFITASAIGYYGSLNSEDIFLETDKNGNDFLSKICYEWENSAKKFKKEALSKRVGIARIGIILSDNGGALGEIIKPFKFGLGSVVGNGKQYVPWIHISDMCSILNFMITNSSIDGVYNSVAPQHNNNKDLSTLIGKIMKRPIWLPNIPSFIFKVVFGEMSTILLKGSRVSSEKIINKGFNFQYKNLKIALENILK